MKYISGIILCMTFSWLCTTMTLNDSEYVITLNGEQYKMVPVIIDESITCSIEPYYCANCECEDCVRERYFDEKEIFEQEI